jgi:hypothetical protein
MRPRNLCGACGEDFCSVRAFDDHRVGHHAYTYSEGVRMQPMREDGRRCLDADELAALGYRRDEAGAWFSPCRRDAARAFFGSAAA